jgi:predicted RNA-binding protein (virulence factor B family)
LSEQIIAHLKAAGGTSQLTDKTPPEVISRQFGVSKGSYKKALGALYKARRIDIGADRITLLDT